MMKGTFYCLLLSLSFFTSSLFGQDDLIINVPNRSTVSLNGKWHYIVDPYETGYYDFRYHPYDSNERTKGNSSAFYNDAVAKNKADRVEYSFDQSPTLLVPGDWNSQEEKLFYYEGVIWYKRDFDFQFSEQRNRVFLYFGAVNYHSEVYLNGEKLGIHEGGFTPFNFEVTNIVKEKDNYLVVKVDNKRSADAVPTLNTDWWNYGGITRDVNLIETKPIFIEDYFIQLEKGNTQTLAAYVQLDGATKPEKLTISIPELGITKELTTDEQGKATTEWTINNLELWSPENPKRYEVVIKTAYSELKDQIGFRTIETNGQDILLNGESIFLRGICMHEENTMRGGRAYSEADAIVALSWAKELNCNFMRLAHYPHNEHIVRMADEQGILLWEEIPVYWTIDFTKEEILKKAQSQLTEMVTRDKNRASTIIWSMANETPESEERNVFLKALIDQTRSMDDTRLVSAALLHGRNDEGLNVINDPIAKEVDIIAFNQYIGWYGGHPKVIPNVKWLFDQNKPVIVSEFGAGALAGYHADRDTRWTEEYQEYLYEQTILMLENMDALRGVTPWILADFRSPKRVLPVIQDGWNRKGLISNTGDKKKAFFIMRNWYKKLEAGD